VIDHLNARVIEQGAVQSALQIECPDELQENAFDDLRGLGQRQVIRHAHRQWHCDRGSDESADAR